MIGESMICFDFHNFHFW